MKKTKHKDIKLDKINSGVFNELKANIQFLCPVDAGKVIMIASAEKGEGRSTTATYLSIALASSEKKTILIDCDLRDPSLHNMFGLSNDSGLVNFLAGDIKFEEAIQDARQKNLSVVTSGSKVLNYAELLVSAKFSGMLVALKKEFDYIIIDSSPLTGGVDARELSGQADGCVLVVKSGKTERKTATKAKEILIKANANILGVFLNKIK
ncbi:MAG: CpsD/CapB family tyrosine-protein kinase [Clostridium sp.]|uniref:CpsD/CapB family tyrosine-protein kinase n=1 Tax=Clostridium sp. TaxID=1506 RepID=UPI003D6D29A3